MAEFFELLKAEIMTIFTSMLPVIELRGGIPAGLALGLSPFSASICAYLGSLLPAPFLLLLIRPILKRLSKSAFGRKIDDKLKIKATAHSKWVKKYGFFGLVLFVSIPLPGTGVWSGAMIATFLDIRFRRAFPAIALGNFIAGVIILSLSGLIMAVF